MLEERYHATTQNRFYPDISNVNKNFTVEAKLISPLLYVLIVCHVNFSGGDLYIYITLANKKISRIQGNYTWNKGFF